MSVAWLDIPAMLTSRDGLISKNKGILQLYIKVNIGPAE